MSVACCGGEVYSAKTSFASTNADKNITSGRPSRKERSL